MKPYQKATAALSFAVVAATGTAPAGAQDFGTDLGRAFENLGDNLGRTFGVGRPETRREYTALVRDCHIKIDNYTLSQIGRPTGREFYNNPANKLDIDTVRASGQYAQEVDLATSFRDVVNFESRRLQNAKTTFCANATTGGPVPATPPAMIQASVARLSSLDGDLVNMLEDLAEKGRLLSSTGTPAVIPSDLPPLMPPYPAAVPAPLPPR